MANNKVVLGSVTIIDITDTTAVAEDVAQGKTFYGADGSKVVGTASGGITPTGTLAITENGTYDVTNYANADVNVSGGGMTETLLWENPNPSSSFSTSSTTITTHAFNEFDYFKVVGKTSTTYDERFESMGGGSTNIFLTINISGNYVRTVQVRSYSGIRIDFKDAYRPSSSTSSQNNFAIPLAVYGVKL